MRIQSILLLGTLSLFSLVGCQTPSTTTSETAPSSVSVPTSPVAESASPVASAESGYPELLNVVEMTQAAVEENNFTKAQQEFDQFEAVWSPVEDGIKEKSSESYDAIEEDMDKVTAALRASNSEEAIAALQAMRDHIQSIP